MNWGTKLVIALGLFMSFIVVLSMKMIFSDKDDLVEKDYYQKGLNYNTEYAKVLNVKKDGVEPVVSLGPDKQLEIKFNKPARGTARILHASNRDLDRVFQIISNTNGEANLKLDDMPNGYWHLDLEWKSDTTSYIFKKKIYLQ